MKDIVNAVADAIEADISETWTIQRHSPIWRDPNEGPMLYIYGTRRFPGEFRTTATREDIFEVVVELMEAASQGDLNRDEAAELAFQDRVDQLVTWADANQNLGDDVHRLDYISLSYQDDLRRELMVRYARLTLHARKNAVYT